MRIHGYVLGVILLAAVGWCMVQESIKQTSARYTLAELARKEDDAKKRLEKLRTTEEALRSPARLAMLVRERKLDLVALGSAKPQPAVADGRARTAANRKPGEVLDEDFARAAETAPTDLADAGYR